MQKEELARRVKEADEQRKVDTYLHQLENEQPAAKSLIESKHLLPSSALDAPSHHEKGRNHIDHHKPLESLVKKE